MLTPDFYVTTGYAILSVVMYFLVAVVIFKNKKIFKGSYYDIILVDVVVNVLTYFNSLYTLRLPKITCKDCFLAPVFTFQYWGINFFGCLFSHFAYVQYLMILSLIFNRFTAVVFPVKHEKIWEHLFIPLMIFNIFGPIAFTYKYFTVKVTFFYTNVTDSYSLGTIPNLTTSVNNTLIPSMVLLTLFSTCLMIATFIVFSSHSRSDNTNAEAKLLAYSVIYFIIQLFATSVVVVINVGIYAGLPILLSIGINLLPYVSDALTFCSPWTLLFCSPTLRRLMKKMLRKSVPFRKDNEISSITMF